MPRPPIGGGAKTGGGAIVGGGGSGSLLRAATSFSLRLSAFADFITSGTTRPTRCVRARKCLSESLVRLTMWNDTCACSQEQSMQG